MGEDTHLREREITELILEVWLPLQFSFHLTSFVFFLHPASAMYDDERIFCVILDNHFFPG